MRNFGVHSEVGKLETVLVCRPGLAHQRLTPGNSKDLLFDDVLWVPEARKDHYDFVPLVARSVHGRGSPPPRVTIVQLVGFVFALFTLYGCGAETVLYGLMLLILGIPVYVWQRRRVDSVAPVPSGGP